MDHSPLIQGDRSHPKYIFMVQKSKVYGFLWSQKKKKHFLKHFLNGFSVFQYQKKLFYGFSVVFQSPKTIFFGKTCQNVLFYCHDMVCSHTVAYTCNIALMPWST